MKSTNEDFFPENLLKSLDLDSSEHKALEVADLFEASMYIWRRKASVRNEMNIDVESKNTLLANRAENTLKYLKHLYPQLSQTTLDISKIQYNTVCSTNSPALISSFHFDKIYNVCCRILDKQS